MEDCCIPAAVMFNEEQLLLWAEIKKRIQTLKKVRGVKVPLLAAMEVAVLVGAAVVRLVLFPSAPAYLGMLIFGSVFLSMRGILRVVITPWVKRVHKARISRVGDGIRLLVNENVDSLNFICSNDLLLVEDIHALLPDVGNLLKVEESTGFCIR